MWKGRKQILKKTSKQVETNCSHDLFLEYVGNDSMLLKLEAYVYVVV